jgi:hypothetical protein
MVFDDYEVALLRSATARIQQSRELLDEAQQMLQRSKSYVALTRAVLDQPQLPQWALRARTGRR